MGRNIRMERSSTTAACCIPQANLMKVMSISSVIFGAPISLISSIFTFSPDLAESMAGDQNTISFLRTQPFKILIFVGTLQTITSVWLLWARDKRRAAKLWTIGHFLSFSGTILHLWNLLEAKPVTNYYLRMFFYFVGVNFCILMFMTLIMIELLLRPMSLQSSTSSSSSLSGGDSDALMRRDSSCSSSTSIRSSKEHYEYKV